MSTRFTNHLPHRISNTITHDTNEEGSALELDIYANSPVIGKHVRIIEKAGRKVSVSGFTDKLVNTILVDVVHTTIIYDCEYTGKYYIMMIRNALYTRLMNISMIPQFMM